MSLYLKALSWCQEIRYNAGSVDDGGFLTTVCAPDPKCDLRLRTGAYFRHFAINLSILQGELKEDKRQNFGLQTGAIGGLWFVEDQNFLHGWLHLRPRNYRAVWDQVRSGGYFGCTVWVGVQPIAEVWQENPLSIVDVSVRFEREPQKPYHRMSLLNRVFGDSPR